MKRLLRILARGLPWLCLLVGVGGWSLPAAAQIGSDRYASIVIDAGTGEVLSAASADEIRYPASLTKMMTIYMLFEALRDRRVGLSQIVPVSSHAAAMMPSKLGLVPGTVITVEQALLGLVTKSANDAAAALGEMLGGDEERFAQMMTLRARALGMSHTAFRNASGWPDPDQVTTARDLALLARHLVQDYPIEYRYFSTPNFMFHGRLIWNHDRMLETYPGADGLKTGYTEASGCNLVTSAVRGNVRLIGVVMGALNGAERDAHMASLLDAGFDQLGVPVSRAEPPRPRFPAMIAAASAASLPPLFMPSPPRRPAMRAEFRPSRPPEPMRMDLRERRPTVAMFKAHARPEQEPRARPEPVFARPAAHVGREHATAAGRGGWLRGRG